LGVSSELLRVEKKGERKKEARGVLTPNLLTKLRASLLTNDLILAERGEGRRSGGKRKGEKKGRLAKSGVEVGLPVEQGRNRVQKIRFFP